MWMSDDEMSRIEALCASSGYNRTKLFKELLNNRPLPDKSYWKTYRQLASLGGLIKKFVETGQHGNAYRLGCEILSIAKELERLEKEGAR